MSKKTIYFWIILFDSVVVAVAIFLGIHDDDPLKHLEERGFLTLISFFQLLAISVVSWLVFLKSKNQKKTERKFWKCPFMLWAIVSFGFLFLAIDERYKTHEKMDERIHELLMIQETGLTDRIDDLIVALYALLGIGILYLYRKEFKKYRQAFFFIKTGMVLLFIMVFLDVISNRGDILQLFIEDGSLVNTLLIWLSVIEDSLKIFAEGYFLVGFYTILERAKRINAIQ